MPSMLVLPLKTHATYDAEFLGKDEAAALFDEIVNGFDVTDKRVRMVDGNEFIAETASYIFTDAELTSFDKLPEVWGGRSPWTESLAAIRARILEATGVDFQVARCVYYRDGSEGVDFHQDLPAYGDTSEIASLSLGAPRVFVMREQDNTDEQFSIELAPGSLLFMGQGCQDVYEHGLPHDPDCHEPRLNLTFRRFGWD